MEYGPHIGRDTACASSMCAHPNCLFIGSFQEKQKNPYFLTPRSVDASQTQHTREAGQNFFQEETWKGSGHGREKERAGRVQDLETHPFEATACWACVRPKGTKTPSNKRMDATIKTAGAHAHAPDSELAMKGASKWGARLTPPAMQLPSAARLSLCTHQRQSNTSRNTAPGLGRETPTDPSAGTEGGIDVVRGHQRPLGWNKTQQAQCRDGGQVAAAAGAHIISTSYFCRKSLVCSRFAACRQQHTHGCVRPKCPESVQRLQHVCALEGAAQLGHPDVGSGEQHACSSQANVCCMDKRVLHGHTCDV